MYVGYKPESLLIDELGLKSLVPEIDEAEQA